MTKVIITKNAEKKLLKCPSQIQKKLLYWAMEVERCGLRRVMQIKGFHDEGLEGERKGQRSIRLNRAYRAFYRINEKNKIEIIEVFDVNKHRY